MDGYVMQTQDLTVNDGDGIRTMVFLAGCPLRCAWCANPEGQTQDNSMVLKVSEDEICERIHRQEIFYRFSGGGITFSGGEACAQPEFLSELASRLYDEGYSLALETCGMFDFRSLCGTLQKMDLIFMDIKHMDPEKHRQFTGAGNTQILENIRKVYALGIPVVIRVPTIIGVNGNDADLQAIFQFIRNEIPGAGLELLPYHTYGDEKYRQLGRPLPSREFQTPTDEQMEHWNEQARAMGIRVVSYR